MKTLLSLIALATSVALSIAACGTSDSEEGAVAAPDAGADVVGNVPDGALADALRGNDGGLCNNEGFCFENPLPHGYPMTAVWSSGPNDVWAIAYPGAIVHYDGATWSQVPLQTAGMQMRAIWGSAANDIWVGGYEYVGAHRELIFHYDGKSWTTSYTGSTESPDFHHLNALWGSGPTDIWAIGDTGTMLHNDGTAWSPRTPFTTLRLGSISGTSPTDVWALSDYSADGTVAWHFDGTSWSSTSIGGPAFVGGVWAVSPTDVWVATTPLTLADGGLANGSSLRHFDGVSWKPVDAPGDLYRLWGSDAKNIWAVGTEGIAHYDGTSWTLASTVARGARWIRGSGPNDVWVASNFGPLAHFDGANWSILAPTTSLPATGVTAVWAASPTDVWAAGNERGDPDANGPTSRGTILHRTAAGWQRTDVGVIPPLNAMFGSAPNDVWAVGSQGTAIRFDGTSWKSMPTGSTAHLGAVWSGGANDVWVGGYSELDGGARLAVTLHFDGSKWSAIPIDATHVRSIFAIALNDVWAASGSAVYHYDGTAWTLVPGVNGDAYGSATIWAGAKNDIWVGASHYDGNAWTLVPSDDHVGLTSVWRRSASDVWFIDAMGDVLRFDGARIRYVSTLSIAGSMHGVGNDLWGVGYGGAIMHKSL